MNSQSRPTASSDRQRGLRPQLHTDPSLGFSSVDDAVAAIRAGGMVVVVDSPDRENEGDLVMAAARVTPDQINFMATHGRGLVCVSLTEERLRELQIPPMVTKVTDPLRTAFHVTVDHRTRTTTGISATDRAETIKALVDPEARPDDFSMPGHTFPLAAKDGGVLKRAGHTEASVDLAELAGLAPAGVICEIADEDGEMARLPSLRQFAERHGLPLICISDLIRYRRGHLVPSSIVRTGNASLPLALGTFCATAYRDAETGIEHLALVHGTPRPDVVPLVRVHSECMTGDIMGSRRCDCGEQLEQSLRRIASEQHGALIYLRGHEGRGIGLGEKLRAYQLQEQGLDTVEANLALGHPVDARDYGVGAEILKDLGITQVRLLTNNVEKRLGLEDRGILVTERLTVQTTPHPDNVRYLHTKRTKLGHMLEELATPAVLS
jgi:3,4-dihydroxy 2-butanone 4-phosphate synthase/GTP cyclohydrolase II